MTREEEIQVYTQFRIEALENRVKELEKLTSGDYSINFWGAIDITNKFHCTNEEAKEVLDSVINGDYISNEISEMIDIECGKLNLKEKEDEN
jgi:hypothetical protein